MRDTPDQTAHRIQGEGNDSVQPRLTPDRNLHAVLSNGISYLESGGSQNQASQEERLWFECVHDYLKQKFKVSLLAGISEVSLRGFVSRASESVKLWNGRADAVGLLELQSGERYKYVIVEWKGTKRKGNVFWEFGTDPPLPYREHLQQCLVLARLLKMHMSLDYLPPSLVVLFN